jgi:hypothetical protein
MNKDKQGIVLDEKAQEQPADKERAQTAHKTENAPKKEEQKD